MLTCERAHELLEYSIPHRGLIWRVTRAKAKKGELAGRPDKDGYLIIGIDGKRYKAHRVVYLMHFGAFPDENIDHIDCDKKNNLIENLRIADASQNRCNVRLQVVNSTGFKGVHFNKNAGKFRSIIKFKGESRFLGYFDSAEDAHSAYTKAANDLHGEYARVA